MLTPEIVIAELDASLARTGQDVVLRRYTASAGNPRPKIDVPVRAFVRPVDDDTVKNLVGNLATPYFEVITSPTGVQAVLPLVRGDKIVIDGKERNIEMPKHIKFQDVLARIKIVAAG